MNVALRHLMLPIALVAIVAIPGSALLWAQGKSGTETRAATKPAAKATKKLVKKATPSKAIAKKGPPPTPAKVLFGGAKAPAPLAARAIGFYAKGCLAGAKSIAINGPAWQVMRLSRNRMWGHPSLIALVEKLATDARAHDGWPGLLVGDLSQPRGGPMLTGHASHQIGLDADIWLTPMPEDRQFTAREREDLAATSMLAADRVSVDPNVWTEAHGKLILRAASYPQVERVLVHPAIKKALCENKSLPRDNLRKVRPYWGHYYHMHIRMFCPKDSPTCTPQPVVGSDDGCGKEVDDWIARMKRMYAPRPPVDPKIVLPKPKPQPKPPEITLADLPAECKMVIGDTSPPGPSPVADVTKPDAVPTKAAPTVAGKK
jgi:penicillin-insensitive murein endopeptidase